MERPQKTNTECAAARSYAFCGMCSLVLCIEQYWCQNLARDVRTLSSLVDDWLIHQVFRNLPAAAAVASMMFFPKRPWSEIVDGSAP